MSDETAIRLLHAQLQKLYESIPGLSFREVSRQISLLGRGQTLSHSTVENLIKRTTQLPRYSTIVAFVEACKRYVRVTKADLLDADEKLFDMTYWRRLHDAAKADITPNSNKATIGVDALGTIGGPASIELATEWSYAGSDAEALFDQLAHGRRSFVDDGDLFSGRYEALRAVRRTLNSTPGLTRPVVITGQPGAGKSTLLARLVFELRAAQIEPGLAILARGLPADAVVIAVASACQLPRPAGPGDLLRTLRSGRPRRRLLIAVDALDEAAGPEAQWDIAKLLVGLATVPGVRIVVATRSRGQVGSVREGSLLRHLAIDDSDDPMLVDLDADRYFAAGELRTFAAAVLARRWDGQPGLRGRAWSQYQSHPRVTARLSRLIAERADRNYLVAAMSAAGLATKDEMLDPAAVGFDASSVPTTVWQAISKYTDALESEDQATVLGLLTALAYARGPGISDHRWLAFATALGYDVNRFDVDRLRLGPATDYLLQTSSEEGARSTRLFHQALVDELVERVSDRRTDERAVLTTLLPADPTAWSAADGYTLTYAADHAAAAGNLSDLLQDAHYLAAADLTRLHPLLSAQGESDRSREIVTVLRRAAHRTTPLPPLRRASVLALTAAHLGRPDLQQRFTAAASGSPLRVRWAHPAGAAHLPISGHSDPVNTVALGRLKGRDVIVSGDGSGTIRVWDGDGAPVGQPWNAHGWCVSVLTLASVGERALILSAGGEENVVRIWDADGRPAGPPLTGHSGKVLDVTTGRLRGQDVIVSSDLGGFVHVWDQGGQRIGKPLDCGTRGVSSVAVGKLDGREAIVVSSERGLQVWDAEGRPHGLPFGGSAGAHGLALGHLHGRSVIVTAGGSGGEVYVWDFDGNPVGQPLTGHDGWVSAVAMGQLDGQAVIVSGGEDTTVRLWDFDGNPIGRPLIGHTGSISALAMGQLGGRDVIVSAGGNGDDTVRVWFADDRPSDRQSIGHTRPISSIAVGRLGGRDVIVSGAQDNTVRMWDLDGQQLGRPMSGHQRSVNSVAVGRLRGRDLVVSGGWEGSVCVWDADGLPVGQPHLAGDSWVNVVAVGPLGDRVIASGSHGDAGDSTDGEVRLWDSEGHPIGEPLPGHDGAVTALAFGVLQGQEVIVSGSGTGNTDGMIRVWDANGVPLGQPMVSGTDWVTALAIGKIEGQEVIVSGDGGNPDIDRDIGTVKVWDTSGRMICPPLTGHVGQVRSVAISRRGGRDFIISGSRDGTVRLWHLGRCWAVLDHIEPVYAIAVAANFLYVASGSAICAWEWQTISPMII